MRNYRTTLLVVMVLAIVGGAVATASLNQEGTKQRALNDARVGQFPITDYFSPEPADREKKAKRKVKSGKYDKSPFTFDETTENVSIHYDWEAELPAFPVARSSAVILGEVVDAQAHLSNLKNAVYSEFTIKIGEVLKNSSSVPLSSGDQAVVERLGGRVRLPNRKVGLVHVRNQNMPRVGSRYVLFLEPFLPFPVIRDVQDQSLYILTGYELRTGLVYPLDDAGENHPISDYKGVAEASFLSDLRSALSN